MWVSVCVSACVCACACACVCVCGSGSVDGNQMPTNASTCGCWRMKKPGSSLNNKTNGNCATRGTLCVCVCVLGGVWCVCGSDFKLVLICGCPIFKSQCGVVITRSYFPQIFTKDIHSSPVRARYRSVSFVGPASDWYSAWVPANIYAISYYIGPRYNGTRL